MTPNPSRVCLDCRWNCGTKFSGRLRYDFVLGGFHPYIIELHGEQHYDGGSGNVNDAFKRQLAFENFCPFLEIKYSDAYSIPKPYGPAGSTVAALVKRYSPDLSVLVLEKTRFPRHHIGESLLAASSTVLHEMGAYDKINRYENAAKAVFTCLRTGSDVSSSSAEEAGLDELDPHQFIRRWNDYMGVMPFFDLVCDTTENGTARR